MQGFNRPLTCRNSNTSSIEVTFSSVFFKILKYHNIYIKGDGKNASFMAIASLTLSITFRGK